MEVGSSPTLTLDDVLEMDGEILANLVIEKFLKHTPCKIRFRPKPRQSLNGSLTMDDQTGILFGCKYTTDRRKPFEFGIYFKDPLLFENDNKSISLVERPHRHHKVFSGPSFVSTCYYNWDEHGTNKTMYKKDTYNCTEVKLIPGNDSSWQKTTEVFPFAHRHWKSKDCIHHFLVHSAHLPLKNVDLISQLSPVDCDPRHFNPIHGRSSMKGRGFVHMVNPVQLETLNQSRTNFTTSQASSVISSVTTSEEPNVTKLTSEFTRQKRQRTDESIHSHNRIECPGCQRFIKTTTDGNGYEPDNSHPTQDCCNIQVCKVFF